MTATRRWSSCVAAAAVALALAATGTTQAQAQDLARVYTMTPNPGTGFELALQKHVRDRMEMGDPWNWGIYQVVNGANLGDYLVRSGDHAWADLDAYEEGFAARIGNRFQTEVGPTVMRMSNQITRTDTERSRIPESFDGIQLYELIHFHVKPGKLRQLDEAMSKYHQAIRETDWPGRYAYIHLVNGDGPQRTIVVFHENWASFEPLEPSLEEIMAQVHGEREAKRIGEQFDEALASVVTSVIRYRPDLSVTASR